MPLTPPQPYEEFLEKIKWLKANPKTYRVHTYDVRTAQNKFPIEIFGNRLYFVSVPTQFKIRFNEPENDGIDFARPIGFKQDFYRIYLDWTAAATDNSLMFIAGWDLDLIEMSDVFKKPLDLLYLDTPQLVDLALLGTYDLSLYNDLLLDYISDIDGILKVYTSFDGVAYNNFKAIPVNAGAGDYKTLPIESKYAKIYFEKAVPGTPQALFNLSVRARI